MPPRKALAMENVDVDFLTDVLCPRTINKRTLERDVRTKMLTFVKGLDNEASVYVVDEARRRHRRAWTSSCSVDMIGTRNGLICVLDGGTGAVTLANPTTRESLSAGLLPCSPDARTHEAHGFAFHSLMLRYAAVYTLVGGGGDTPPSWRSVPTPGACGRFQLGGVACVDGVANWITAGTPPVAATLQPLSPRRTTRTASPGRPGRMTGTAAPGRPWGTDWRQVAGASMEISATGGMSMGIPETGGASMGNWRHLAGKKGRGQFVGEIDLQGFSLFGQQGWIN
uniref:Uncharacterized protein n=1 Tax=Oryza rufipogon TaxID=4529 RepID=A0A0E0RHI7_ORYRU